MQPSYNSQNIYPTPQTSNENLTPATNEPGKKPLNKLVLVLSLLLILALSGIYFVYSWQHKKVTTLSKQLQTSNSISSLADQVSKGELASYEKVKLVNDNYSYSFQFSKNALPLSSNGTNSLTGTALDGHTLITVSAKNAIQDPVTTTCPSPSTEITKVTISSRTYSVCNISTSGYIYDVTFQVGEAKHLMVISTANASTMVATETLKTIMQSVIVTPQ